MLYDYDKIIELYNHGMTYSEICENIGCERAVIQRCLRRTDIDPFKNGLNKIRHAVEMLDKNYNKVLQRFDSQSDAADWIIQNGYSSGNKNGILTNIGRVIKEKRKTCCGFGWRQSLK